jgi:hypothetical protein
MDPAVTQGLAGVSLVIVAFGMLLAILWILVPFAIFGIKPLLRRLVGQLETIEKQNADVLLALRDLRAVQQPVVLREERPPLA